MDPDQIKEGYREMIGRVPPKVAARIDLFADLDAQALSRMEELRADFLDSSTIPAKYVQLMVFAILLTQTSPAAKFHALAAIRAGATPNELLDATKVAFLFRGLAAMNHAGEILTEVFAESEAAAPVAD